jgi:hypothetical protein
MHLDMADFESYTAVGIHIGGVERLFRYNDKLLKFKLI